jgi:hypothetical protein
MPDSPNTSCMTKTKATTVTTGSTCSTSARSTNLRCVVEIAIKNTSAHILNKTLFLQDAEKPILHLGTSSSSSTFLLPALSSSSPPPPAPSSSSPPPAPSSSSPPPAPSSSSASTNYSELAVTSPSVASQNNSAMAGDSGIDSRGGRVSSSASSGGGGLVGRPQQSDERKPLWNRIQRQVRRSVNAAAYIRVNGGFFYSVCLLACD